VTTGIHACFNALRTSGCRSPCRDEASGAAKTTNNRAPSRGQQLLGAASGSPLSILQVIQNQLDSRGYAEAVENLE